ncbi:MAG: isoprenylcysteine carboxylmethyltransferase family protein [Gammaproteobacteria bacterium]|nr:isoprenylcysteine carboxylmethyltransferase family protein [Gammaproteobacteria bacterium]MBU1440792.1 isoprenylcysteine carboxylmethyltransferase family protein [Gammaproteobacteria bacterium]MBU2287779.1 isoprenylcysteine carboxylmethyltransferase family protein [Gammaproteobacteria bacterium]MBU2411110.1 isoprenylcysteine carboxylmethyltransferase family protein [Gammaproteobacteria bacterium]
MNHVERERLGSVLVVLQFALLAWLAWLGGPALLAGAARASCAAWAAVIVGVSIGLWSLAANRPGNFNIRPTPRAQASLVTTGPYRWIRHPMYTSLMVCSAGAAMAATAAGPAWTAFVALVAVLTSKALTEERWLKQSHAGYAQYMQRTKRFVPGLF